MRSLLRICLLVLDEPTSALGLKEATRVLTHRAS
jgi:ABC-type sugar transport system ATPase subunit